MRFGKPKNNDVRGLPYPILFVTNTKEGEFEDDRPIGAVISGAINISTHRFNFDLILMAKDRDSAAVERQLGDLLKLVKETLKTYHDLRDPTTGTDALARTSFPYRTLPFGFELDGQPLDGFIIKLQVLVDSGN